MKNDYNLEYDTEYEVASQSSKTFRINWDTKHISGKLDGLESLMQTIHLIIMTERYKWPIYSWQYGSECASCIGEDYSYVQSEVKRMITDALSNDNRILSVDEFKFDRPDKSSIEVSFRVKTIYGDVTINEVIS